MSQGTVKAVLSGDTVVLIGERSLCNRARRKTHRCTLHTPTCRRDRDRERARAWGDTSRDQPRTARLSPFVRACPSNASTQQHWDVPLVAQCPTRPDVPQRHAPAALFVYTADGVSCCVFLISPALLSAVLTFCLVKAEPAPMAPLPRCSYRWPLWRHRSWAARPGSRTSSSPGTPASSCARSASESR